MSNTFCPIPWIFQAARSNGDVRVCCQANVTPNKGVIRKSDGTAYNAGKDNLTESRNADLMKSMRKNMLNGIWSQECGRCQTEEENGLQSRRQYESLRWNQFDIAKAQDLTDINGAIDTNKIPLQYYDLRFGNFCNLKCRMCGPTDSDSWYTDWIQLTGSNTFSDTSGDVVIEEKGNRLFAKDYEWVNNEIFWKQLESNIENIRHIYFAGGEPMLIERHYDFLEKCIQSNVAKDIVIEYNTNMTTIPTRVVNLWNKFKSVNIGASVDGMEQVLEYQRHPVKWSKILKNLNTIDQLPPNINAWIAFTVTAYNVNHMVDFMKWKLQYSNFNKISSSKHKPIISYHVAHHPKHLNIRVLPNEMKLEVAQNFKDFVDWIQENNFDQHIVKQAKNIESSICKYMNSDSYHNEFWKKFVDYTNSLDRIRNESLLEVEPLFTRYFDTDNK